MLLKKIRAVYSPGQSCLPRRAAAICQSIIGPIPFRQASDFNGNLTAATSISSTSPVSQYKYGGKEWNPTSQSYDFGARNYLPGGPRYPLPKPLPSGEGLVILSEAKKLFVDCDLARGGLLADNHVVGTEDGCKKHTRLLC